MQRKTSKGRMDQHFLQKHFWTISSSSRYIVGCPWYVTMKMSKFFYYLIFFSDFNLFPVTRTSNNFDHFFKKSVCSTREIKWLHINLACFFNSFFLQKSIRPYSHCCFIKTVKLYFKPRHLKLFIVRQCCFAINFLIFWKLINNFYLRLATARSHHKYFLLFVV